MLSIGIREQGQERYWSNRAKTYGHQYGLDRQAVRLKIQRKVALMAKYISFKGKAIEFGCGTGLYTKEFVRHNRNLLATDISESMLAEAKQYCPNARFSEIDARRTHICYEAYDVVLSAFVLQHVDTTLVLPEMYRILKVGGSFGAFVPNIVNLLHYSRARVGIMRKILKEDSQSIDFDRWEWQRLLPTYGFKDVRVIPIEFTSPYMPSALIPFGTRIGQLLEAIPVVREYAGTLMIVAKK